MTPPVSAPRASIAVRTTRRGRRSRHCRSRGCKVEEDGARVGCTTLTSDLKVRTSKLIERGCLTMGGRGAPQKLALVHHRPPISYTKSTLERLSRRTDAIQSSKATKTPNRKARLAHDVTEFSPSRKPGLDGIVQLALLHCAFDELDVLWPVPSRPAPLSSPPLVFVCAHQRGLFPLLSFLCLPLV